MNIARMALDALDRDPDRPAIVEGRAEIITRGQLRVAILDRAQWFSNRGMRPGDRVVLQARPGVDLAVSAMAILALGSVIVLAEAGMIAAVYRARIAAADPRWFVVNRRIHWVQTVPGARGVLCRLGLRVPPAISGANISRLVVSALAKRDGETPGSSSSDLLQDRADESDAVIVFTGGTTLTPKGVRLSHGALVAYLDGIVAATRPHAVESFVADTPQQILLGLLLGQQVWVPAGLGKRRLRSIGGFLATGGPDMFFGPPSTWVALLRLAETEGLPSPTGLKLVLLGGAPVSRAALSEIREWIPEETDIRVLYGLTEIGPACVCGAQTRIGWQEEGNLVGVPLPGVEIEIETGEADSDIGEIILRAPSLYSGYLGETVVDPNPVLRTGDLGRLVTLEGRKHLVLMGRKKDMIIRCGINLYPPSIEPIVEDLRDEGGHRLVEECSLIGVWDESCEDEVVVLCFVPARDDHSGQLRDEVSERLARQLGPESMPDALIPMSRLPTVGRQQKPDKRALRRLAAAELGLEAYSAVTQEPM